MGDFADRVFLAGARATDVVELEENDHVITAFFPGKPVT
jgi:hypothetical protein